MNHRMLGALLVALIVCIVAGCKEEPAAPATTGTISGKVTHEFDGTPVGDVVVTVQETGDKATSDAQGNYIIKDVQPGTYNVNAAKDGFDVTFTGTVVVAGKTSSLDIFIAPPLPNNKARITGRVYDEEGLPLAGATITTEPATKTVTSNAQGMYSIAPVNQGYYTVTASKTGLLSESATADTRFSSEADSVNFTLVGGAPTKGLTAYYAFDGNANDGIASNNGTVQGATFTTDRFDKPNSALSLNGSSSFVTVPSSAALNLGGPSTSFTISLWVKYSALPQNNAGIMMKGKENGAYTMDLGYRIYSGEDFFNDRRPFVLMGFRGPNTSERLVVSESPEFWSSGGWRHVVVVYDRTAKKVIRYSQGFELQTDDLSDAAATEDFTTTEPLYFGKTSKTGRFFNGAIDDVRIYNRALLPAQIKGLFHERDYK